MNKQEITTLALKILSVFFVFKIIDKSGDFIYFLYHLSTLTQAETINFLISIVPAILYAIFGITLWFVSKPMAISIFGKEIESDKIEFSIDNVQLIAFMLAGFFLLADTLPQLAELLVYNFQILYYKGKAPFKTLIAFALIKILVGFWLLLGSKGVIKFVKSMRHN